MIGLLGQSSGGFWMPPQASTVAGEVDGLFNFILWITIFFFIFNTALVGFFVWKYRYRPGREKPERAPAHSTSLELTWTVVPTVVVLVIFYFGFRGFLSMSVMPPDAYEVRVNAKMWNWSFTYPNGHTDTELHVPYNVPVRLILTAGETDVIHSFYVPQFRIKRDVVPTRYNRLWFQATEKGNFDIYCAEYCGQQHSQMRAKLVVEDIDDFKRWLEERSNWENRMTPIERARELLPGCLQCHTEDDSIKQGPSFKDLFGKTETLANGTTVPVDEDYIRESIFDPQAKVVAGFRPQMPSYRGQLSDRDIDALIAYLKSISVHSQSALPASGPGAAPGTSTAPTTQ